jgi:L-cystine uptake protein TcyP (sodium:dicarboxylate symporter family)
MKIKTILTIVLFILIIGSGLKYLGLCVSDKYETQLEGLNPTEKQIKKAEDLKAKIDCDKKITLSIIVISLISFYPVSLVKK